MSDLQAALVVIGILLVVGIGVINWLQERGLRRRLHESFGAQEDVLLGAAPARAPADGRLEPRLSPQSPAPAEIPAAAQDEGGSREADPLDAVLDYVAVIEPETPVTEAAVVEVTAHAAAAGRPVRVAGLDARSGRWEDLSRGGGGRYTRLHLGLQLVTRSGPVNAAQLAAFCDAVRSGARRLDARADCPDPQAALKRARELDEFCARVDVAIGLNVVAAGEARFQGPAIRAAAEEAGFRLEADGVFHFRDGGRLTLFTLDNHEPAPFLPESINGLATRGVTLLLDVPRAPSPAEALDRMTEVGRRLAQALGGELVDDNRAFLTDAGIQRIREQVQSIQAAMEQRGIPAGGERALRLFS